MLFDNYLLAKFKLVARVRGRILERRHTQNTDALFLLQDTTRLVVS